MAAYSSGVIVDVGGASPPLSAYTFIRATATDATLTGIFTNSSGMQVSEVATLTIGAVAKTFQTLLGAALPEDATAFHGILSEAIYLGFGGKSDNTMRYTPEAGYPRVVASDYVIFGRSA